MALPWGSPLAEQSCSGAWQGAFRGMHVLSAGQSHLAKDAASPQRRLLRSRRAPGLVPQMCQVRWPWYSHILTFSPHGCPLS